MRSSNQISIIHQSAIFTPHIYNIIDSNKYNQHTNNPTGLSTSEDSLSFSSPPSHQSDFVNLISSFLSVGTTIAHFPFYILIVINNIPPFTPSQIRGQTPVQQRLWRLTLNSVERHQL